MWRRKGREELEADPRELRSLKAAAQALTASLGDYGAQVLGDYTGPSGATNNEVLELLSALYNGEMRPVRRPSDETDIGQMLPYRRASFGLDAMELRGSGGSDFAAILSLKDYPEATSPGLLDALLRLPCEMVVSESFAPHDRQVARERIDLVAAPPALGRRGSGRRTRRHGLGSRRAGFRLGRVSATIT